MSKERISKTNAMRVLDEAGIEYEMSSYPTGEGVDTQMAAKILGVDPAILYKTIVLEDGEGDNFVAVIASESELDLKKVAAHFGVKHVSLINWKTLRAVTGYIRGGCSPLAMKKPFPTVIDENAILQDRIFVSGGVRGVQMVLSPVDLARVVPAQFADIVAQTPGN